METEDSEIARISGAHELGLAFIRALILLNSGSIVVLMTYISGADADSLVQFSVQSVKLAMTAFLIGIVAILIALIVSYVYTALNTVSRLKNWLDTRLIPLNALFAIMSLSAFICGVLTLIQGTEAGL